MELTSISGVLNRFSLGCVFASVVFIGSAQASEPVGLATCLVDVGSIIAEAAPTIHFPDVTSEDGAKQSLLENATVETRELIAVIIALVVSMLLFVNRGKLATVPHYRILVVSFALLAASLVCSVIEGFCWDHFFNFLQHTFAPTSLMLLAIWSWFTFVRHDGVSA